jgi:hypothetical protein
VHCEAAGCYHQAAISFDDLDLPDETIFDMASRYGLLRRKFRRPFVSPEWCVRHQTDSGVAIGIHASS